MVLAAVLGNLLHRDRTEVRLVIHVRTAIRQLFDHSLGLAQVIENVQSYLRVVVKEPADATPAVVTLWLENVDGDLRRALASAWTAVHNWGDLSDGAVEEMTTEYVSRDERLAKRLRGEDGGV